MHNSVTVKRVALSLDMFIIQLSIITKNSHKIPSTIHHLSYQKELKGILVISIQSHMSVTLEMQEGEAMQNPNQNFEYSSNYILVLIPITERRKKKIFKLTYSGPFPLRQILH